MTLALFDLDDTVIDTDSDSDWSIFMANKKLLDPEVLFAKRKKFKEDYNRGELNVEEYYSDCGKNYSYFSMEQLIELREEFITTHIVKHILPKAVAKIEEHKKQGHTAIVISATNSFLVSRIAEEIGFDYFIATEIAIENNRFLPKLEGTPSLREGKVIRIKEWLESQPDRSVSDLKNSWFYSDSLNDIPLLEEVAHPVAVNPDATLQKHAKNKGWRIMDFRN